MRVQKIVYNAITITFTIPCRPWTHGTVGIGAGMKTAASGVVAGWVTRSDRTLRIRQRLRETEWAAFRAFLDWAQVGGTFAWYPDAAAGTNYTCYLVKPEPNEHVEPVRGEFPGELEVEFMIRRTNGAPIDEVYWP